MSPQDARLRTAAEVEERFAAAHPDVGTCSACGDTCALAILEGGECRWCVIAARVADRDAAIAALVKGGERPLRIPAAPHWGVWLLVHRDVYPGREGKWRLTRFDAGGAFGHTDAATFEAAIREAAEGWGARLGEAVEP